MKFKFIKNTVLLFVFTLLSCRNQSNSQVQPPVVIGAQQTEHYLPILKNKNIGIVANQTTVIFKEEGYTHLVDSLLSLNIALEEVVLIELWAKSLGKKKEVIELYRSVSERIEKAIKEIKKDFNLKNAKI